MHARFLFLTLLLKIKDIFQKLSKTTQRILSVKGVPPPPPYRTPLTDNHFPKKPLQKGGVPPPPLNEKSAKLFRELFS